jgi:hypothetical protein
MSARVTSAIVAARCQVLGTLTRGSAPMLARMPVEPDQRRLSFNRDPGTYHEGRPPYPRRVYDLLTDRCGPSLDGGAVPAVAGILGPGPGRAKGPARPPP